MEIEVTEEERNVAKMSEDKNLRVTLVSFKFDIALKNIVSNVELLGKLSVEEKPIGVVYHNLKQQQAQATATGKEKQVIHKCNIVESGSLLTSKDEKEKKQRNRIQSEELLTYLEPNQCEILSLIGQKYALYKHDLYKKELNGCRIVKGYR